MQSAFLPFLPPQLILGMGLALTLPLAGADQKTAPANANPLLMPVYEISKAAIDNFGLGLEGFSNSSTKKVERLFITYVAPESDADREGIKPGDEIVSINGKGLEDFKAGAMEPGGEIFALLINRPAGEKIKLGIVTRSSREVTLRAMRLMAPLP